jgi:hypothetical protein
VLAVVAVGVAITGCGGGDDDGSSPSAATRSVAAAPTLDGTLRCLNAAGILAKRQSSIGDSPDVIGIDTTGGRTVIDFAKDDEQADLQESLKKQYGKVVREGLVTASLVEGSLKDEDTIRGCMAGGTPTADGGTDTVATATAATDVSGDAASSTPTASTTIEGTATTPTDGSGLGRPGAVAADAPTAEEVRQCLRGRGVAVRDEANTTGDGVEIAHPGDLMTSITFEANEGIAKAVEGASKKFGDTLRVGTIVAALAPKGEPALDDIRACITP